MVGTDRRPISARALILGAILAVAAFGLALAGAVTFLVQRDRILSDVDERLVAQVDALRQVADLSGVNGGVGRSPSSDDSMTGDAPTATEQIRADEFDSVSEFLRAAVARLVPGRNEASVAVIDGRVAYRPSTLTGFDISQNSELIARAANEAEAAGRAVIGTASTEAGVFRYIAVPIELDDVDHQGLYLRAIDLTAELEPLSLSMWTYTISALATLAATGIVGWFVAGRILSPIRHLREAADSITITDLGARIPALGNDDIADLTRTVNSMLDRLEGSVDGQRQLLDDVRHELKTPITIVRGHLEMMDVANPDDVSATRDIGIGELDRLTRLVEDIDLLSSAEGDQFLLRPLDVGALTDRIRDLVSAIPDHSWTVTEVGSGVIEADEDRLLQAWLQLADNAAKYTPAGSPIELGSANDDSGARLWVADHGPGIPITARRRIFRRFDRADVRRSVGGSGLGLAIVDAIAKAHRGTCVVTETPGGGATFTIHLPATPTAGADLPAPVRAGDVVLQREASS